MAGFEFRMPDFPLTIASFKSRIANLNRASADAERRMPRFEREV
jgi:hypothetical protein